MHNMQQRP